MIIILIITIIIIIIIIIIIRRFARSTGKFAAIKFTSNSFALFVSSANRVRNFDKYRNRPFPSCPKPLFQSKVKCEAIDMKMTFYSHANKNFALSPVFKMRVCGTRKWPIHHAKKIFPVTVRQWAR